MAAMKLVVAMRGLQRSSPLSFNLNPQPLLLRRRLAVSVRPFSALMSPPSTAVVYHQQGPPDTVTKIMEIPPVEMKETDVCVRMLASPINPSDINRIEGVYPVRPTVLPAVGGYEGVGEVHSLGSSVKGFSPGDLVIPCPPTSENNIIDRPVWMLKRILRKLLSKC